MIAKFMLFLALVVPSLAATLPYIIGGESVPTATRWPHQCSLQSYGVHSCGASIISSFWVVTAGHCVSSGTASTHDLVCGTIDRFTGQKRGVSLIIMHEDYGTGLGSFPNDIAVVKLSSALIMSDTVRPIEIWDDSVDGAPAGNTDCYITGWGYTTTGGSGSIPTILQEALVIVHTNTECKRTWGSSVNDDSHVCLGDTTNMRGSCSGDSGGPLVCRSPRTTLYKLVGAASWGIRGCSTTYPSVYSRVSYFRQWIGEKTGQ